MNKKGLGVFIWAIIVVVALGTVFFIFNGGFTGQAIQRQTINISCTDSDGGQYPDIFGAVYGYTSNGSWSLL